MASRVQINNTAGSGTVFPSNVNPDDLKFDPTKGHIIRYPGGKGYGYWVGGMKVTYDEESGLFVLFYRQRTPLEKGRGGSANVAVSKDGMNFEDVWNCGKIELNANSIEVGHVVRDPRTKMWHLYISYEYAAGRVWRVDVITGKTLDTLDTQGRRTVIQPGEYGLAGIKDPFVYVRDGMYYLYAHTFSARGAKSAIKKLIKNYGNDGKHRYIGTDTTGLSVSKDGFYFEEIETVFDAPNDNSWDGKMARLNSLVPYKGGYFCTFDGQRTAFDRYEEKCGICWSPDGKTFHRERLPEPWVSSPHGSKTVRYVYGLRVKNTLYWYYEYCIANKSHVMKVSKVELKD